MANETKPKQSGAANSQETSGQSRQQQAEQRSSGQPGSEMGQAGAQGGQQQRVPVRQGTGGSMQQHRHGRMSAYARDPFSLMQQLSDEMDQLFDSFFQGGLTTRRGRRDTPQLWAPEIDIREETDRMKICVDLPGVPKDNVKINVEDGQLTIEGERREESEEGGEEQGYRRSERRYGSFYRSIPLPEGANADKAQAQMKEGVLEITVPCAQRPKGRRLEIQG